MTCQSFMCYTSCTALFLSISPPSQNHAGHWGHSTTLLNFHCTAHWCNRLTLWEWKGSRKAGTCCNLKTRLPLKNTIIWPWLPITKLESFQVLMLLNILLDPFLIYVYNLFITESPWVLVYFVHTTSIACLSVLGKGSLISFWGFSIVSLLKGYTLSYAVQFVKPLEENL